MITEFDRLYEEMIRESKLSKNTDMVKKALIDADMDIVAAQINDKNVVEFAQWVLKSLQRSDSKKFKKYLDLFKKNKIIKSFKA